MKYLMNICCALFFVIISFEYCNSSISAKEGGGVSTDSEQKNATATKSEEDVVIHREDIIFHSGELKTEVKKDTEKPKAIENTTIKNQKPFVPEIVEKCLKEGKKYEARNILSDYFLNKKIPDKQREIKEVMDTLNEELIFSQLPTPDTTVYEVQSGDVLARIAKQFNTNYELIMRVNKKPNARLNIGEKLKILTGKTKILISKAEFTLTLLLNDHYIKQYRIGTGKDNKTPVGTFEVKNMMKEPTWYSPFGGVFPYGHKENILGTRWIGFKDKPGVCGYGIHGTTLPESIGTASSNGCIRMVNSDVEELYDFVTTETEIIIQE